MKRLNFTLTFAILLSSVLFFSCSKKDEVLVFPELIEKEFAPNSEGEFTFKAGADWTLASSTAWCQFVDEDGELVQTLDGSYGDQTIKFKVNAVGASFDKVDVAEFTIVMENQTKVIYKLTRTFKKYEITVLDAAGNAVTDQNPIVIKYGESIKFSVNGNFEWAVTEKPEWVTFTGAISGTSDVKLDLESSVTEGLVKSAQTGMIYIGSQADPKKYAFAVKYDGIPADKIEFSTDLGDKDLFYFEVDGKSYFFYPHPDHEGFKYNAPFPITVSARNDEYTAVSLKFNKYGYDIMQSYESWFAVEDDKKGNLKITVRPNSSLERFGAIVVLPKAVATSINGDFDQILDKKDPDYWEIKNEYRGFLPLNIKQYGEANGFNVTADGETLAVEKLANAAAIYGTDNVYVLTLENKQYDNILIQPKGVPTGQTAYPEAFWNNVDTRWSGIEMEANRDSNGLSILNIWGVSKNNTGSTRTMILGFSVEPHYKGYLLVKQ